MYAGAGSISKTNLDQSFFKFQGGVGIEYLISNKIGFFVEGEYNMLLSDDLDGRILGEKNDMFSRLGFGLNVYF